MDFNVCHINAVIDGILQKFFRFTLYLRSAQMSGSGLQKPWTKITQFAFMSLVCFALGAMLLFFMVWQGEKLIVLGLMGRLYYIILLPLGLSVSGFLFA